MATDKVKFKLYKKELNRILDSIDFWFEFYDEDMDDDAKNVVESAEKIIISYMKRNNYAMSLLMPYKETLVVLSFLLQEKMDYPNDTALEKLVEKMLKQASDLKGIPNPKEKSKDEFIRLMEL